MELWLIVSGLACLANLLALNTIGKNYKSNGLMRGVAFIGVFAAWGIATTLFLHNQGHWLYYACNVLSAALSGVTLAFGLMSIIRSKQEETLN